MTIHADQIGNLLQYIGADDYQNWIRVGMALKSEFGDSGLQLWDKWSQSSEKYKAYEIPKKWESFRDGGIGLGTVIYLAQEQGFKGRTSLTRGAKPSQRRVIRPKPKTEELHDEANSAWKACKKSDDYVASHPYKPKLKGAYGAGRIQTRIWGRYEDYILVPCVGVDTGLLVGVETITPDGSKRFLGKKTGCLILGNDLQRSTAWWAFEGWATAAYCLQERFVETAIVAFGKSRQEEVANRVAHKYSVHVHIALEQD